MPAGNGGFRGVPRTWWAEETGISRSRLGSASSGAGMRVLARVKSMPTGYARPLNPRSRHAGGGVGSGASASTSWTIGIGTTQRTTATWGTARSILVGQGESLGERDALGQLALALDLRVELGAEQHD